MENVDTKDMAKLCLDYFVNVETGKDVRIKDLKYVIKSIVGLCGEMVRYGIIELSPRERRHESRSFKAWITTGS